MKSTPFHALIASPVPRDRRLVEPYVRRATGWMRTMVYVFVGMYVLVALIGGTADMMGGHAEHWWQSYAKGFGYGILPGLFFIGPVTMFWLVNRSQLLTLGENAPLVVAQVVAIEQHNFRGNVVHDATIRFVDPMGFERQAKFQGPKVEQLAVGNSVHVLVRGSNAAVLWAPDVLITGRIR